MSNKIQVIQDKAGNNVFPITHEKAVRDSSGVSLEAKLSALESKTYVEAWDGASTPVVANIPAGVVVSYDGTSYTGTLAASSSTDGKIYLVKDGTEYDRYASTINLGGTYIWSYLGTTAMSLSGYATEEEFNQLDQEVAGKINAMQLAYTDVEYTKQSGIVSKTGASTTSSQWHRYVIPNKGYSRIKVTAYTSTNYMAIAFYNSETWGASTFMGEASVVGKNYTQNYDVAIPEGCKTIIVCNWTYYRALPDITLYAVDITANIKEIEPIKANISELTKALSISNADRVIPNYTIYYSSGAPTTSDGRNIYLFKNYGFVKVDAYLGANSTSFAAIAFYNTDVPSADSFMSAVQSNNSSARDYSATVPEGCKLIAISARVDLVTPSATIYLSKTQSAFDKMDERYNELKGKVGDTSDIVSLNDPVVMPHILQQMKFTEGVASPASVKPLLLLHFSDIHGGNTDSHYLINKTTLQRIIQFKSAYNNYIDDILCTGDQCYQDITDRQDYNNAEDWWDAVEGSDKILPVLGNHDTWASGSETNGSAGQDVSFNTIFNHIADCSPTGHPDGKCYYYKDYATQGIRLIVVDPYYSDSAEETWFSGVLDDAINNDLSVIIAIHPPFNSYTPLEVTFNSLRFDGSFNQHVPTANYISMVETFVSGGGKLICWLTGHVHGDVVGYYEHNGIKQLAIGVPSAKAPRNANTTAESGNVDMRIIGTKSQDSFNLVSFETTYKTVTVKRIGSDYDVALRHRGILTINYETMEVLYNN